MIFFDADDFIERISVPSRLLGIDFGTKRMGFAISDPGMLISTAYSVYTRKKLEEDFLHIKNICDEKQISAIVMGLPLNMDNSMDEMCELVFKFAEGLSKYMNGIHIFLQDERFTSRLVVKMLDVVKMSRRKKQKIDDKLAASVILQNFIDYTSNKIRN